MTSGSHQQRSSWLAFSLVLLSGCAANREVLGTQRSDAGVDSYEPTYDGSTFDVGTCAKTCSIDGRSVLDPCAETGAPVSCGEREVCREGACLDACSLAEKNQSSVGCDYWAVGMDIERGLAGSCFVSFVTNTFERPAHVSAEFRGGKIDLAKHAAIPRGDGKNLTYEPYDPVKGLAVGEVLILFLSQFDIPDQPPSVHCPIPAARQSGGAIIGTGINDAFHVKSDVPVVAYQMLPYGGGAAAVTAATLLLPTSAWGKNYVATTAHGSHSPSFDIVASEDDTTIEILPRVDLVGLEGLVPAAKAGTTGTYTLAKGEVLQITQQADLTGSPIAADKKIAFFAGHPCMNVPADVGYCDHAEQQIPPVSALGHEYVAAPHRPRMAADVSRRYRIIGVADGTNLSYEPEVSGPATLSLGEAVEIVTDKPFVVRSQDAKHPFMLFGYMGGGAAMGDYGDPEFVRMVTPEQYLEKYVFLTDPTYPETNLVIVRKRGQTGFADVELDCLGKVTGFVPVGASGSYEIAWVDLVSHDFEPQGTCNNGVHTMTSSAPFGVWVWGWGGPETSGGSCLGPGGGRPENFTCHVSYAYPAGESIRAINDVVVSPRPK